MNKIFSEQETCWTCGPACAEMFLKSINIEKKEKQLIHVLKTNKIVGTRNRGFYNFAKKFKLTYIIANDADITEIKRLLKKGFFVIVCYYIRSERVHHYSVVKKVTKQRIYFLDPYFGPNHSLKITYFEKLWNVPAHYSKEKRWFIALKKPNHHLKIAQK